MRVSIIDRERVGVDTPSGRTTVRRVRPYRARVVVRPETPGGRLRRLRLELGWDQIDLAEASGVAANTISDCEGNRHEQQARTLGLLARCLRVSMDYLWFGEEAS